LWIRLRGVETASSSLWSGWKRDMCHGMDLSIPAIKLAIAERSLSLYPGMRRVVTSIQTPSL